MLPSSAWNDCSKRGSAGAGPQSRGRNRSTPDLLSVPREIAVNRVVGILRANSLALLTISFLFPEMGKQPLIDPFEGRGKSLALVDSSNLGLHFDGLAVRAQDLFCGHPHVLI